MDSSPDQITESPLATPSACTGFEGAFDKVYLTLELRQPL